MTSHIRFLRGKVECPLLTQEAVGPITAQQLDCVIRNLRGDATCEVGPWHNGVEADGRNEDGEVSGNLSSDQLKHRRVEHPESA